MSYFISSRPPLWGLFRLGGHILRVSLAVFVRPFNGFCFEHRCCLSLSLGSRVSCTYDIGSFGRVNWDLNASRIAEKRRILRFINEIKMTPDNAGDRTGAVTNPLSPSLWVDNHRNGTSSCLYDPFDLGKKASFFYGSSASLCFPRETGSAVHRTR